MFGVEGSEETKVCNFPLIVRQCKAIFGCITVDHSHSSISSSPKLITRHPIVTDMKDELKEI